MLEIVVRLGFAILGFLAELFGSAWLQGHLARRLAPPEKDEQWVQQEADRVNAWLRTQPGSTVPKEDGTP